MKQACLWQNVLPDQTDFLYIHFNEIGQFSDIVGDQINAVCVVEYICPEHECCILKVTSEHC